ncbi:hypothetical protein BS47DRAFT_1383020 [Hydnum rufescens UP504]|uniref:Uncharacterized protein n=1 Tax=Hydnum rufescens UP504 TaxID=1448309 RepID=A0A9P6AVA4_9AGAM|nr:hypothetical protein BS47DRAFT_1383020 [Hydnum rufescens UP504]
MSHVLFITTYMNSESSSKHFSWWNRKLSQQKTPSDSGQTSTRRGVLQALRPGSSKTATSKDHDPPGSTKSMDEASLRCPMVTITSSHSSAAVKSSDGNQDPHRRSKLRESDSLPGRYKRSPTISSDALSKTVVHHTLVSPSQSSALPLDSTKGERRRRSHTTATSLPSHPSPVVETSPPSASAGPSSSSQQDTKRTDRDFGTFRSENNSDIRLHVSRAPSYSLPGREQIANPTQNLAPVITAVQLVSTQVPKSQPLSSPSSLENIRRPQHIPEQSITSTTGGRTRPVLSGSITSMQSPSALSFSSSASGDSPHVLDISPLAFDYFPEVAPSSSEFTYAERPLLSPIDPIISYRSPARLQTASNLEAELPPPSSYPSVLPSSAKPGKPPSNREESSPSCSPARNSGSKWNVLKRQRSLAPASHHLDVEHPLRHYSSFSSPGSVVLPEGASSASSISVGLSVSGASSPLPGSPTSATTNLSALTDSKGHDAVSKALVGPIIEPISTSQIEDCIPRLSRHGRGASTGAIDGISEPSIPSDSSGIRAPVVEPLATPASSLGMHILPPSEMERVLQTARTSEDGQRDLDGSKAKLGVNTTPMKPTVSITSYSDRTIMLRRISESPSRPHTFMSSLSLSRQSSIMSKDGTSHVLQRPSTGGGITSFGGQPIIPVANVAPPVHSLPPPPRRSHSRVPRTPPPGDRPQPRHVISTVSVGPSPPAILEVPAELPSDKYRSWSGSGSNKNKPPERVRRISATSGSTVTTAVSAEDFPEPTKAIISVTSGSMGATRTRSILKRPSFLEISSETDEAEPANFLELDNRPSFDCGR